MCFYPGMYTPTHKKTYVYLYIYIYVCRSDIRTYIYIYVCEYILMSIHISSDSILFDTHTYIYIYNCLYLSITLNHLLVCVCVCGDGNGVLFSIILNIF